MVEYMKGKEMLCPTHHLMPFSSAKATIAGVPSQSFPIRIGRTYAESWVTQNGAEKSSTETF